MIADYHVHTYLCRHARGTLAQFVAKARKQDLTEMCFTDHIPCKDGYDPTNRMTIDQFPVYRREVKTVARANPDFTILFGMEADFYEGMDPKQPGWIRRQNFDLVLGSVHYVNNWGIDDPMSRDMWNKVDVTATWKVYFAMLGRMADLHCFDVIGHLDLPKKFGYRPPEKAIREMAKPALDRIAAAGMAVEINTSGLRKPVKEIYPSPQLLELARKNGIPICFGSDSHRPEEVGYEFKKARELARSCGYTSYVRFRKRKQVPTPIPAG